MSKKKTALVLLLCVSVIGGLAVHAFVSTQAARMAQAATRELLRTDARMSEVALRIWRGEQTDAQGLLNAGRELELHQRALQQWDSPESVAPDVRELVSIVSTKRELAERLAKQTDRRETSKRALQRLMRRLKSTACGPLSAEVTTSARISLSEPLERDELSRLEPKLRRLASILSSAEGPCHDILSESVEHAQIVALGRRDTEKVLDTLLEVPVAALGSRALGLVTQVVVERQRLSFAGGLAAIGLVLIIGGITAVSFIRTREEGSRYARDNQRLEQQNTQLSGVNQDLAEALQASRDAMKAKYQFLANISHELRTPLNGVMGSLDLIADEPLSENQVELLSVARRSSRDLLNLIDRLFCITEDADRALEVNREVFELSELLDGIDETFGRAARGKGLIFSVQANNQIPVRWKADLERLRQVLENLVENAIKFTQAGFVKLDVQMADGPFQGLCFEVADSGVGIDSKHHDAIFQSFFQVVAEGNRRQPGAGLGLAVCKRHALAMAGTISLDSRPGKGSTFRFEVPMQPAPVEQSGTTQRPASSSQPRRRVLVVEDDEVNQQIIRRMLEKRRLEVTIAADGQQALNMVEANYFDLILMDLQMPVMDGLETATRIRERDHATPRGVPIVALTATVSEQARSDCERVGMNEFLCKPITGRKLDATLRQMLQPDSAVPSGPSSRKAIARAGTDGAASS